MAEESARLVGRDAIVTRQMPDESTKCGAALEERMESFILVSPSGEGTVCGLECRFCTGCPIVLLEGKSFDEMAMLGGFTEYAIAGFADLDAVPEDKHSDPLGSEDNPLPMVKFASITWDYQRPQQRKAGRNDPCPCGSGMKYKKCCGRVGWI